MKDCFRAYFKAVFIEADYIPNCNDIGQYNEVQETIDDGKCVSKGYGRIG